jgi:two-component sensor histidine kinase
VYRKLEDGKYRFRVRACLSEDACTTSSSLITIDIDAPFWRSWWFYVTVALVMALTVQLIIKLRERSFKETEKYLQGELLERINEVIQHEKELEAKNTLLEDSIEQQKTILRDVHSKVKNNLKLISNILGLQVKNYHGDDVSRMLQDSQSRITIMALLYKNLYGLEDIDNVPVQEYVENLCQIIDDAHENDSCKVSCSIDMDKALFDVDACLLLGMILNEIITNSYKYAFADRAEGIIDIGLVHLDGERYKLTVGDNGIGLPKGHATTNYKTLGFRLIHELAQQLNGNVNCVTTEKGTRYNVTFNIPAR